MFNTLGATQFAEALLGATQFAEAAVAVIHGTYPACGMRMQNSGQTASFDKAAAADLTPGCDCHGDTYQQAH
jgi:hypothetical protein